MRKQKSDPENKTAESQKTSSDTSLMESSGRHWPFDNAHFAPFNSLRREVDVLFNQFTDRFGVFSKEGTDSLQMPALDVDETETAYEISAEMPGVAEADIDVSVTDNLLTIHGEKQQSKQSEDADRKISECSYGIYERSLALPFSCEAKSIEANYSNGVLHLSVPKPKEKAVKPQKVAIKSAA